MCITNHSWLMVMPFMSNHFNRRHALHTLGPLGLGQLNDGLRQLLNGWVVKDQPWIDVHFWKFATKFKGVHDNTPGAKTKQLWLPLEKPNGLESRRNRMLSSGRSGSSGSSRSNSAASLNLRLSSAAPSVSLAVRSLRTRETLLITSWSTS